MNDAENKEFNEAKQAVRKELDAFEISEALIVPLTRIYLAGEQAGLRKAKDILNGDDPTYCKVCHGHIGDGHDCDNCSFCGTDN